MMDFHFDTEAVNKLSIEEVEELEKKLWREYKKISTILAYKRMMKE